MNSYFSKNYEEARKRFCESAKSQGATLESLVVEGQTPEGKPLTIDIAWLGSKAPQRVVLHSSGLHGVEGFAGSAIQLNVLEQHPELHPDQALILIHCLNPYGMAWLRRTNENNVDLNRNFILNPTEFEGASDIYRQLNPFLNPKGLPYQKWFYFQLLGHAVRFGISSFKQALAEGQYEFPKGLFFGGKALQPSLALYYRWIQTHLHDVSQVIAIDAHTGLGNWKQDTLFIAKTEKDAHLLPPFEGRRSVFRDDSKPVEYMIKGGCSRLLNEMKAETIYVLQELGTYSIMKVLKALHEENAYHHQDGTDLQHPSKQSLKAVFCPHSEDWRNAVVLKGASLLKEVLQYQKATIST